MIYNYNFENGVRAKVWISAFPQMDFQTTEIISQESESKISFDDKSIVLELCLPKNASNYALLGLKYNYINDNKAKILINTSDYDGNIYEDNIALRGDTVRIGIPKEYIKNILEIIRNKQSNIPLGTIFVSIGAHAEIGSSSMIFGRTFRILLELLKTEILDKITIKKVIEKHFIVN